MYIYIYIYSKNYLPGTPNDFITSLLIQYINKTKKYSYPI